MCAKCGVRHGAPPGKKCTRQGEGDKPLTESQERAVSNGLQASPSVGLKAVDADHLARAADERIDKVENSVTEMKTMMTKMLKAVGVKETENELTESPIEMSSDDGSCK